MRPKVYFKKLFLKISQNSQENTRAKTSVLIKLLAETINLRKLWCRCFHVNLDKFIRTAIFRTPPNDYFYVKFILWNRKLVLLL